MFAVMRVMVSLVHLAPVADQFDLYAPVLSIKPVQGSVVSNAQPEFAGMPAGEGVVANRLAILSQPEQSVHNSLCHRRVQA